MANVWRRACGWVGLAARRSRIRRTSRGVSRSPAAVEEHAPSAASRPPRARPRGSARPQGDDRRGAERHDPLLVALAPHRGPTAVEVEVGAGRGRTARRPAARCRRGPRARRRRGPGCAGGSSSVGRGRVVEQPVDLVLVQHPRQPTVAARGGQAGRRVGGDDDPCAPATRSSAAAVDTFRATERRALPAGGEVGDVAAQQGAVHRLGPGDAAPLRPLDEPGQVAPSRPRPCAATPTVSEARKSSSCQAIGRGYRRATVTPRPTRSYQGPCAATQPSVSQAVQGQRQLGHRAARCAAPGAPGSRAPSRTPRAPPAPPHRVAGVRRLGRRPPGTMPSATSTSSASRTGWQPSARQLVGAGRGGAAHRAGHGHDVDVAVHRLPHRQQRPPARVGLHHHDEIGQRGDDAVAGREPPRRRAGAERRLAEQHAPRRHGRPEVRVAGRVGHVVAAADHADRRCPRAAGSSSTPRWAAPSMPRASPETTATPAAARSRPSARAIPAPAPVQRRVPTIATRGAVEHAEVALGEQDRGRDEVVGQLARVRRDRRGSRIATPAARCRSARRPSGSARCPAAGEAARQRVDRPPPLELLGRATAARAQADRRGSPHTPERRLVVHRAAPADRAEPSSVGSTRRPSAAATWAARQLGGRSVEVRDGAGHTPARGAARGPTGGRSGARSRAARWRRRTAAPPRRGGAPGTSAFARTPRRRGDAPGLGNPLGHVRGGLAVRLARAGPRPWAAGPRRAGRTGRAAARTGGAGSAPAGARSTGTRPDRPPGRTGTGSSRPPGGSAPGCVADAAARATRTTPSSSGCRSASITCGGNSASSSRKSTPLCAR